MIHVEKSTGKSYRIHDMSEEHLVNTVDMLIRRLEVVNRLSDENPRYLTDFESVLSQLSAYGIISLAIGILNPIQVNRIQTCYEKFNRVSKQLHIQERKEMPSLLGSALIR